MMNKLKLLTIVTTIIIINLSELAAQEEAIDTSIEDFDRIMNTPMTLESISSETIGGNQGGVQQRTKRWRYRLGPIGNGTLALMHLTIEVTYTVENNKFKGVINHNNLLSGGGFGMYFNGGSFTWNIADGGKYLSWYMTGVLGFNLWMSGSPIGWSRTESFSGFLYLDSFGDFDGDGGDAELINVNRT